MDKVLYHITDNGPKVCKATLRPCPLGGVHTEEFSQARAFYEEKMSSQSFNSVTKAKAVNPKTGFTDEVYYGGTPPRAMQIDALNAVASALEEDSVTQLVAACGTGKSYMGRQLMRRMMEAEEANGVAIVLTSSIKLAKDTAADLRPDSRGNYDHSMGEYGEDYVVIEVNSDSEDSLVNKAVSVDKIAASWKEAAEAGKKVIIVSTYQSSSKIQEVQAMLTEGGLKADADLLMNDEAHNILGQQRSLSAKTEGINTGYRSFHNEIPGAIQASKRLYATATPVVQEKVSDDESTVADLEEDSYEAQIKAMQAKAELMASDPKARITVYSDDSAIVGGVSGYISQKTAIETNSLAKPDYQLRAALIKGNVTKAKGGYVDSTGTLIETGEEPKGALTVQTYSAVSATLNAMASDAQADVNPVHNALAYCGSIAQAKAFRDNFKKVALAQSGEMSLEDAKAHVDSKDLTRRREARMRLLAEHVDAQAAYSGEEADVKRGRANAFNMFKDRSFTAEDAAKGWSPHKKVLANVDIFSEGVSINEIDTVIISDDEKTSERAMTQAIGRAIRRVPSNPYKTTGHVIIPQAVSVTGEELNGGSVAQATYGATRVERGVAISKLAGVPAKPDNETMVAHYSSNGDFTKSELASTIAKKHITSKEDVIVAHTLDRAHKELLKADSTYKERTSSEQYALMVAHIEEKSTTVSNRDVYWAYAANHVRGKTTNQLNAIRQSNRVLVSALGANDVSSLSPELTKVLINKRVLEQQTGGKAEPTRDEKQLVIKENMRLVTAALTSVGAKNSHPELHQLIVNNVSPIIVMKAFNSTTNQDAIERAQSNLSACLNDSEKVDSIYSFISREKTKQEKFSLLHDHAKAAGLQKSLGKIEETLKGRAATQAVAGNVSYKLNRSMVRTVGDLTSAALAAMVD